MTPSDMFKWALSGYIAGSMAFAIFMLVVLAILVARGLFGKK